MTQQYATWEEFKREEKAALAAFREKLIDYMRRKEERRRAS